MINTINVIYSSKVKVALLSVHDKTDVIPLATALVAENVVLIASNGTAEALRRASLPVVAVADVTKMVILDGRIKTIHPAIFAGISADRRLNQHMRVLKELDYRPIDLVVCNFYPFTQVLSAGADTDTLIEMIDVGGPALIRAAAKNANGGVTVITDPRNYRPFLGEWQERGHICAAQRRHWAAIAFAYLADYDQAIADWTEKNWLNHDDD